MMIIHTFPTVIEIHAKIGIVPAIFKFNFFQNNSLKNEDYCINPKFNF